jgi:hypothetical protein
MLPRSPPSYQSFESVLASTLHRIGLNELPEGVLAHALLFPRPQPAYHLLGRFDLIYFWWAGGQV